MLRPQFSGRDWLVVALHLGQLVTACAVIFFYAKDYTSPTKREKYQAGSWAFGFGLGGISGATAILYFIARWIQRPLPVVLRLCWDALLFLCWGIVMAIFGSKYLQGEEDPIMRQACFWDAASLGFWFISLIVAIKHWKQYSKGGGLTRYYQ